VGNSAKPSDTWNIPNYPIRMPTATHTIKQENIRVEPTTSVSDKYTILIEVAR